MANNTTFHAIPNNVLLCSVVFKFIAMIIVTIRISFVRLTVLQPAWAFMSASTATLLAITDSRSLSIYYKTSKVSADCDTSTSVSRCFRNLDNCLLHFHCSVYSSQKLRHLASKCLLLTKQHCLLNRRFYCISSSDFDILPQLTSIFCLLREFNVSVSFLKQRSPALTIPPKNQPTG